MIEDQASKLRFLAKKQENLANYRKTVRTIAISSGKGGVGKTNFTVNFGIALSQLGQRVVIFDGDLGLANIDVICGLTPKDTLQDVITDTKTIAEILVDGPGGIKILPGASGQMVANLDSARLQLLIEKMQYLEDLADILLIDTGAGISKHVIQLLEGADEVVVVVTPEPTSVTDAYSLVKILLHQVKDAKISILINQAGNKEEAYATFSRFEAVVQRFLHHQVRYFGMVLKDQFVTKSVMRQTPFVVSFPQAPASHCIKTLAEDVIGVLHKSAAPGKGIRQLLQGLMSRFTNNTV